MFGLGKSLRAGGVDRHILRLSYALPFSLSHASALSLHCLFEKTMPRLRASALWPYDIAFGSMHEMIMSTNKKTAIKKSKNPYSDAATLINQHRDDNKEQVFGWAKGTGNGVMYREGPQVF